MTRIRCVSPELAGISATPASMAKAASGTDGSLSDLSDEAGGGQDADPRQREYRVTRFDGRLVSIVRYSSALNALAEVARGFDVD